MKTRHDKPWEANPKLPPQLSALWGQGWEPAPSGGWMDDCKLPFLPLPRYGELFKGYPTLPSDEQGLWWWMGVSVFGGLRLKCTYSSKRPGKAGPEEHPQPRRCLSHMR